MASIAGFFMGFIDKLYHYGLPFVVVLSILVFVHEFGHFWVARRCGVKIETFSIGFGKELFGWTDKLGTRWRVAILPIGGFVKMFGDADVSSRPDAAAGAKMDAEERKVSFMHKKLWQKALVVVAGPAANFLFAIVALAILYSTLGQDFSPAVIKDVQPESAAAEAGLQPGDKIVSADGTIIESFEQVREIIGLNLGQPIQLGIERAGQTTVVPVTPKLVQITDRLGTVHHMGRLGVGPTADIVMRRENPALALWRAVKETYSKSANMLDVVWQMIIGVRSTEDLGGPISIGQMSGVFWSEGFVPTIEFMVLISINLGLVNLFPIAPLDGGHLLFYAIEAVFGRSIGERVLAIGFRVGLAVFVSFYVFIVWHDLARLMHMSPGT